MPEPLRRARFQIHLSTAIVLMFVAGGLIWANVHGRRVEDRGEAFAKREYHPGDAFFSEMTESEFLASNDDFWVGKRIVEHGWPVDAMQTSRNVVIDRDGNMARPSNDWRWVNGQPKLLPSVWRTGPIIYNALVALAILFAVWFLCERLIRIRGASMALLARLLFYPTLLWNVLLNRLLPNRHWWDWIDDTVLLGALPLAGDVPKLKALGIGAVVNTCQEYAGPLRAYEQAGIEQFRIPTVDFTPPSLDDIEKSVRFIQAQAAAGKKVYVHCKAGRGRSATVVICYLISKGYSPEAAQKLMLERRRQVLARVYKREVVQQFAKKTKISMSPV